MTPEEVIARIEELSDDQIRQIEKYLHTRRDKIEEAIILTRIQEQIKSASQMDNASSIKKATKPFDIEVIEKFAQDLRESMSEEEFDEMIAVMEGKPIISRR